MRILIAILFIGLFIGRVSAQTDQEINQFFSFEDGIYLSYEALLKNQPDIKLEDKREGIFNNPLRILRIDPSEFGLTADQEVKFVVDQGLPYHRSNRCCPDQIIYVGLTIVGHLSVISYDSEEIVDIPMKAYNPYNGEPFLKGTVKRERTVKVNQVLNLKTGKVYDMLDEELKTLLGRQTYTHLIDELIEDVVNYNLVNRIFVQ